ncbi:hypothetical protein NDI37_20600 [Funiculus sociatus GB2-A5]|uniref:DUF935 family protein n=1 Tax=Funiculus sociatus GB2-A5 TaxID=2933946 RepID=A0ABV0JW14_9CYAN|nr:hypothetical protein [Trichocoleus sp. FACHB-832]MBD2063844.1 hypothetical protein [Trichocoleus sp. FACHB-6]
MDAILERSHFLKQALIEFVMEAEGELAESLETYAAQKSRSERQDIAQRDLIIDTFLTEGKVGDRETLDIFLENQPDLSPSDRNLVSNWRRSFIALFAVIQVLPDGFELMNWLTAKHYIVKPNNPLTLEEMTRFKEGEILLSRIAPITDTYWMFSGPCIPMGRLGKPKLAVAIGNFKDNYKNALYSDAPELLELAWQSVEQYHQDFLEFFGSDEVTLPGYQLNKKIEEFQEILTKRRFAAAGIDENKSLSELAEEAGMTQEEMKAAAEEAGADSKEIAKMFDSKNPTKMVTPKVELPASLKKAEQLTALTHPRWGQLFLPTYSRFKAMLEAEDWQNIEGAEKLVRQYLEDPAINVFIWHRLAKAYPNQLEKLLQTVLQRPEFKISDLDALLQEYNKPLEPYLPEIASVPLHLHNLFQEALAEVNKSKPKGKGKKKLGMGFQR